MKIYDFAFIYLDVNYYIDSLAWFREVSNLYKIILCNLIITIGTSSQIYFNC